MSVALQMTHTCAILNPSGDPPTRDADNQPIESDPVETTGVMCRWRELSQTEIIQLQIGGLDDVAGELTVGMSAPVAMRSRVQNVTNRRGETLHAGPSEVVRITTRGGAVPRYRVCTLQKIGPQGGR